MSVLLQVISVNIRPVRHQNFQILHLFDGYLVVYPFILLLALRRNIPLRNPPQRGSQRR